MLANSEVFSDEDIIDELLDFLVAGTQTTQMTTQYALACLMTEPECLARVRAEFDPLLGSNDSTGLTNIEEVFKTKLGLDSISDLTYLGFVCQEALRQNPIAPVSSPYSFERDTKAGNLKINANEIIMINIWGLHHNGN